ncbi:MAG: hypothetical protein CVU77_03155 [Elusimicrobia bacterium HGW-Elusimicrobia-1]|jgi:PTS system mannose-specific IIC component|nr:MAG: hypothetical protein CVU77_03155 [Elusimicrobia bacterium HGW-Elusimicrobia-1]
MNEIVFALVGAFLAMDAVVFGQFGFSRPIVCGPVAGFLVGDPVMGLRVGVILELIWINTIPIGTTLVPDVAVASLLSVFWSSALVRCGAPEGVAVVLSMGLALPVSMIFRKLDLRQRARMSRFNARLQTQLENGDFSAPARVVLRSAAEHFFRNAALFFASLMLSPLFCSLSMVLPRAVSEGLGFSYLMLPAVGLGVFFYNFYDSVFRVVKK